jgi:hypothetical protein
LQFKQGGNSSTSVNVTVSSFCVERYTIFGPMILTNYQKNFFRTDYEKKLQKKNVYFGLEGGSRFFSSSIFNMTA